MTTSIYLSLVTLSQAFAPGQSEGGNEPSLEGATLEELVDIAMSHSQQCYPAYMTFGYVSEARFLESDESAVQSQNVPLSMTRYTSSFNYH